MVESLQPVKQVFHTREPLNSLEKHHYNTLPQKKWDQIRITLEMELYINKEEGVWQSD